MRMRRKKNLDERLDKCGDMIFRMDRDVKDFSDKSNKQIIDIEKSAKNLFTHISIMLDPSMCPASLNLTLIFSSNSTISFSSRASLLLFDDFE